jgi:ATP-dependent Zn protease
MADYGQDRTNRIFHQQALKELGSFVRSLTDEKEKNIQQIITRKKEICEEIHKILL